MKPNTLSILFAVACLLTFASCQKSLTGDLPADVNPGTQIIVTDSTKKPVSVTDSTTISERPAFPSNAYTHCDNGPKYGDSILYLQPSSNDYIVKPINQPDSGTYFSWPEGMVIDKMTGAINVTKSEGGLRYSIGYVKKGTKDTCLQTMILGGASYADSLYILSNNSRYAAPYFDADPNLVSICDPSGGPGGNKCEFDVNGTARNQGIIIEKKTGLIDLKNTAARAFGLIPLNGTKVTTTIAYQLNDKSSLAPQKITVQFIYYDKKSNVPADLVAALSDKLNKILNQVLLVNLLGSSNQQLNRGNPRPPIIIVTRSSL